MSNIEPKVWLITGISRGLGRALAEEALAAGHQVIGTTRSGTADIDHPKLSVISLEITNSDQVSAIAKRAIAIHGRIDVLVNNAGYGLLGAVEAASDDEARQSFDVSLFGPLRLIQTVWLCHR